MVLLALASLSLHGGNAGRALALPPKHTPCSGDTVAVASFVRRFVADLPEALRVPRGAFVLVCGGHPDFAMGFGKTTAGGAVDPGRAIFRAASNSKLFVATAALQLSEQGRWSLTDDVNQYLPTTARLRGGLLWPPITLDALLTHTAGIEEKLAGAVTIPADRVSLAEFFSRPPLRVRKPGFEVSYSNIGMALAGYLVEVRSEQSFARYAAEHLFAPLGMSRSSFDQPPPAEWTADLAGGSSRGVRDVVFNAYPAASLVTTPLDMGRFIAAQLNGGALDASAGGGRVLSPAATALMHASHWRPQPAVPGVAYGFFEGEMNGHHTLFHTGDSGDHSLVFLLPGDSTGFYLVFTGTDDQTAVRERFISEFMDTFYPGGTVPSSTATTVSSSPRTDLAGTYRTAAFSRSNYEKLKAMFAQIVVHAGEHGNIFVTPPGAPSPIQLRPSGSLVFRGDSGEIVVFREDDQGKVVGFTVSGSIWDPASWDRVGPFEDGRLHLALFLGVALLALMRLTLWPLAALAARLRHRAPTPHTADEHRWWRWSGAAAALLVLAPIIGLCTAFLSFSHPLRAVPRAVGVLGYTLLAATVAGIALVPFAVGAWRHRKLSFLRRVHLTLLAAAFVLLVPLLHYWRLLPL
jgi:CubicO group peptidase (beta-lactamase class C family)